MCCIYCNPSLISTLYIASQSSEILFGYPWSSKGYTKLKLLYGEFYKEIDKRTIPSWFIVKLDYCTLKACTTCVYSSWYVNIIQHFNYCEYFILSKLIHMWCCHSSCNIWYWCLDGPTSLSNYLDCKQRGVTGAKRGAIKWAINRDVTLGEGKLCYVCCR